MAKVLSKIRQKKRKINMYKIVLASASPRRCELLKQIGIEFSVCVSDANENNHSSLKPEEVAVTNSEIKALDVYGKLHVKETEPMIVIGADTVVTVDGLILGKPKDYEDAYSMLSRLQGRSHEVCTGITIVISGDMASDTGLVIPEKNIIKKQTFSSTKVYINPMSDEQIKQYIDTGDPFDKAGGYGIQGMFARHISRIEGDYYNVVGLPVSLVYEIINKCEL